MGRIVTPVTIKNAIDASNSLRCEALVDTGAAYLTLPIAWKERLGALEQVRTVEVEIATQEVIEGAICGPVRIELEGFAPIFGEVLFVDMAPRDGVYEPLIGYITLEQSQAAVDMVGHRLVHVKRVDLKGFRIREI
jgi:predicted aspartyl protease